MTARYRYVFADIRTDTTIGEYELVDASFDRRIIVPGEFSGRIPVVNRSISNKLADLTAGKCLVHVYRDATMWGTYLIWTIKKSSQADGTVTADIAGASLESGLNRRRIDDDATYAQVDQLAIARDLIVRAQNTPAKNLLIDPGPDITSGILRDRTYLATETDKCGKRLEELANVQDGFEWMISTYDTGTGQRVRQFRAAYPQLFTSTQPHLLTMPGNVIGYTEIQDANRGGTRFLTRGDSVDNGAGTSVPLLSDDYVADDLIAEGWPIWDMTEDRSGVIEQTTLNAYAGQLRDTYPGNVPITEVEARIDGPTSLNPNNLGDMCRVVIVNVDHPLDATGRPTFSQSWRLIGMAVKPPSRDDGRETAKLLFQTPEGV